MLIKLFLYSSLGGVLLFRIIRECYQDIPGLPENFTDNQLVPGLSEANHD